MNTTLIFVYYGESGLFNTLTHVAHKISSPQTYPCNLCIDLKKKKTGKEKLSEKEKAWKISKK